MKRIYLALMTVLVSLGLAGGATFAVWSDTVTVSNNQVQTGTADLEVSTDSGGTWNTSTKAASIVLSNVIPGGAATTAYDFSLWNNSTTGVSFDVTSQITTIAGLTGSPDQTKLLLNLYESGTDPDSGSNTTGWVTLAAFQAAAKNVHSNVTAGIGNFKNYKLGVKLDSTAANEWQGQNLTFIFTVTGTQP